MEADTVRTVAKNVNPKRDDISPRRVVKCRSGRGKAVLKMLFILWRT